MSCSVSVAKSSRASFGRVLEERARRALTLGERGVAVHLAPEHAVLRRLFDAHRVAARGEPSVGALHLEAMDTELVDAQAVDASERARLPAATRPTTLPSSVTSYAGVGPLARFIASSSLRTVTENASPRATTEGPSSRTAATSGLPTIAHRRPAQAEEVGRPVEGRRRSAAASRRWSRWGPGCPASPASGRRR